MKQISKQQKMKTTGSSGISKRIYMSQSQLSIINRKGKIIKF